MVHCANGAIAITPHTGLDDALFFCVGLYRKVCNGFLTFFEGVNIGCFLEKKGTLCPLMLAYVCMTWWITPAICFVGFANPRHSLLL
jgi:hypothetical protein